MASLWVPDSEHNRRVEGERRFMATLLSQAEDVERLKHWNREVAKVDRYVQVFRCKEDASHPSLKPGYWCLIRQPPVGMPSIVLHETPEGEYRELDSSILQTLRDADMWNSERQRDREKMAKAAQKAQEREEEREREARVDEIVDRLKARTSPGVLISKGI